MLARRQSIRLGSSLALLMALALLLVPWLPAGAAPAPTLVVRYPNTNGMADQSLGYRMLDLALRNAGRP